MIHARNFSRMKDLVTIEAVSDADSLRAKQAADELGAKSCYDSYETAIRESGADAVIIATPTKYHCDIAVMAAKNGMHIFCEKPMAMTTSECEKMIAAAQRSRVILQVGFMRRFCEDFVRAKEIVDAGGIGQVVMIKSLTRGPSTPQEWMYDIQKSNGPLAEVNSHDIDTLRWFSGSEAESVYASGGNYRCIGAKEKYPDFYDTVLLNIRMKNGVIGCIEGAQGVGYGYDARLEILGTEGMIRVGELRKNSVAVYTATEGKKEEIAESWRNVFERAYLEEDKAFLACVAHGSEPEPGGIDGMQAVAIVKAGNRSLSTGEVIRMEEEQHAGGKAFWA